MWTRDEFVSYSFLLAVTAAGLGLLTLAFVEGVPQLVAHVSSSGCTQM
jgi:hypothetical protein